MLDQDFDSMKREVEAGACVQTPMPQYLCHKKVWALKIKKIVREQIPMFKGATCRGCFALGTACGHCERCEWEKYHGAGLGAIITPEESGYGPFMVDAAYLKKHDPQLGGYYVVYKDGYKSFSPASEFEDGYTKI